jgi:hypothetical protein
MCADISSVRPELAIVVPQLWAVEGRKLVKPNLLNREPEFGNYF